MNNISLNRNFNFFNDRKEKISIFIGAYGSGKSEISVNTAFILADNPKFKSGNVQIAIADLDIVNPFFRSADAKKILEKKNIKLISSVFANTNAEVPAVPAEVYSVFDNDNLRAVFDIGGDDSGCKIVGGLKDRLEKVDFSLYFVVNTKRPFTDSIEKIIHMMRILEDSCKIKITDIINNTNLLEFSQINDLIESNKLIGEVSAKTGVPFAFCCGMEDIIPKEWNNKAPGGEELMVLRRTINYYGDTGFLY